MRAPKSYTASKTPDSAEINIKCIHSTTVPASQIDPSILSHHEQLSLMSPWRLRLFDVWAATTQVVWITLLDPQDSIPSC